MKYFTVLTNLGAQKIATATANNATINLTHIAVGDSNGTQTAPTTDQTKLVNEVFRAALSEKKVDENNLNHIVASSVIPVDEGNFWIREVGVFDEDGDLIAVGNYPETFKSLMASGAAKEVILKVVFEVANTDAIELIIDPTVVMASQEFVNEKLANKVTQDEMNTAISAIQTFPIGYPMLSYKAYDFTIVAFGGEFNRADYPKLWEYLEANPSLMLSDADWHTQNNANGMCGLFSSGNGTTTFRAPNLNEAFFRASNRDIGSFQSDAIRNITGVTHSSPQGSNFNATGVFAKVLKNPTPTGIAGGSGWTEASSDFDASRVVPTADENRPKNIALLPLIVAK